MVYTVIFEVDIKNNQILFFHTGSLSVKLKAGILYDYEKFLNILFWIMSMKRRR